jgi:hypothetical protein
MNAARQRLQASRPVAQPPEHYARKIMFSPWPPLMIVAAMEVVAAIGVLAR